LETGQQSIHAYLIDRCKKGDRAAQNELYKLFAGAMFNICRRMMGDDEEARDILQDSFIDVFVKLKTLKDTHTFPAWIKRIVVNNCINALRKKKLAMAELEDHMNVSDEEPPTSEEDVHYEIEKVMRAMDQISEGCRVVTSLYLFEGYDHKEIAQILRISESASKAQYSKARSKIRRILAEQN